MTSERLIFLSCTNSKRDDSELLPAVHRYDGPPFRVLRKFINHNSQAAQSIDVFVLSAKFGLIRGAHPIPNYDEQMTAARARELNRPVIATITTLLQKQTYKQIFVGMGSTYLDALEGYQNYVSSDISVIFSSGTPGRRLSMLHDWLYSVHEKSLPLQRTDHIQEFNGVTLDLTYQDALDRASCALRSTPGFSENYQTWYTIVDGHRVAPKWLVSQITGVPVKKFHTDAALRILRQLGFTLQKR